MPIPQLERLEVDELEQLYARLDAGIIDRTTAGAAVRTIIDTANRRRMTPAAPRPRRTTMSTLPTVHSMSGPDRLRHVDSFVGKRVEVVADGRRDRSTARTFVGKLVTVAAAATGAACELAIVHNGYGRPQAISLATIITIAELELEAPAATR